MMRRIKSPQALEDSYSEDVIDDARINMQCRGFDDYDFWHTREQIRMDTGIYTPVIIDGDDPNRFLHVSPEFPDVASRRLRPTDVSISRIPSPLRSQTGSRWSLSRRQ